MCTYRQFVVLRETPFLSRNLELFDVNFKGNWFCFERVLIKNCHTFEASTLSVGMHRMHDAYILLGLACWQTRRILISSIYAKSSWMTVYVGCSEFSSRKPIGNFLLLLCRWNGFVNSIFNTIEAKKRCDHIVMSYWFFTFCSVTRPPKVEMSWFCANVYFLALSNCWWNYLKY